MMVIMMMKAMVMNLLQTKTNPLVSGAALEVAGRGRGLPPPQVLEHLGRVLRAQLGAAGP